MEIMISEDFENELSVTYDGTGHRIESCDVEFIGGKLREITILLRKVEEESGVEEMSEGMMRKLQAERSASGQDQQAAVDHCGGSASCARYAVDFAARARPSGASPQFNNR